MIVEIVLTDKYYVNNIVLLYLKFYQNYQIAINIVFYV